MNVAASDSPQMLRTGLIGLGAVSEMHLAAYRKSAEIKIEAAAEPRAERLQQMASAYGFQPYESHRDMLKSEDLDLVCVLSPVSTHARIVQDCARANVHVLCEKPLALEIAHAKEMIETCNAHGVQLCYGASYRFLPALVKAREIILNGEIGDVLLLTEQVVGGCGPEHRVPMGPEHYPLGGPGGTGMGLADHGIHLIDTFCWLLDAPVTSVFGRANISGETMSTEFVHMNFANKAVAQLLYNDGTFSTDLPHEGMFSHGAGWGSDGLSDPGQWQAHPGCIRIHGSKGALRIFHYANELFLTTAAGTRQIAGLAAPPPAHFSAQVDSFARSIRLGTSPTASGDDGLQALRVLLAIYESQTSNQLVTIRPPDNNLS